MKTAIPEGAAPGDTLPVTLHIDSLGNVRSHQVLPRAKVFKRKRSESIGDKLASRVPAPPADRKNKADLLRYQRELEEWEQRSGLGQRPSAPE